MRQEPINVTERFARISAKKRKVKKRAKMIVTIEKEGRTRDPHNLKTCGSHILGESRTELRK